MILEFGILRFLFLVIGFLCVISNDLLAGQCLIVYDMQNNVNLVQQGECGKQYSPCSSFKIPLSLMGFDSGVFQDASEPLWSFDKNLPTSINVCKKDQNPYTWMKNSCVWYSQALTKRLGFDKFAQYIEILNYGNKNLNGDIEKNNGLTNAWLDSSLKISPIEQKLFLQNMLSKAYPLSEKSYEITKELIFVMELSGGWKLYGKTGSGTINYKEDLGHGWFIGWIEKNEKKIIIVNHLIDETRQNSYAGPRARNDSLIHLNDIINKLEE